MGPQRTHLKYAVAAITALFAFGAPSFADEARLDELFELLQEEQLPNWEVIQDEIWLEWSRSGSSSMDLLLRRGREALDAGEIELAIEHLTALTDHAPEFAEGFNARAMAFFRKGLYGPAIADLQQVLVLNPRHFGALSGLGAIYEQTGMNELAFKAFSAARTIQPHDPDLKEAVERLEPTISGMAL